MGKSVETMYVGTPARACLASFSATLFLLLVYDSNSGKIFLAGPMETKDLQTEESSISYAVGPDICISDELLNLLDEVLVEALEKAGFSCDLQKSRRVVAFGQYRPKEPQSEKHAR